MKLSPAARKHLEAAQANGGVWRGDKDRGMAYGPLEQLVDAGLAEMFEFPIKRGFFAKGIRLTEKGMEA